MELSDICAKTDKLSEECAVFGVSMSGETGEAAGIIYNGLLALQHRGQEGCGIAALNGNSIICRKDVGLVGEVFSRETMAELPSSNTAVGHNRYSTTGSDVRCNVQPFITEYLTGRIATCHNGNVTNAGAIRENLREKGLEFSATSDSEVISSLCAYKILEKGDIIEGIAEAASGLKGAFSLIVMSGDGKLIAVRDPRGFRPLCIGKKRDGICFASESCALDSCGFEFVRDVEPGEIIVAENGCFESAGIRLHDACKSECIFEYVYFARSDSVIDGLSVYHARVNMGRILAREHPVEADVVCGVPDSGLEAAAGFAQESGIPLVPGFVKNRYIGRSFIYPTQVQRENAVKMKLNPLKVNIEGKRVVLVDDSIVRGTTCAKIIRSIKAAGAKEVHMRISSPPFRHTCHYGTDIDDEENLLANKMTIGQIMEKLGADTLGYISVSGLREACSGCKLDFCTGCFNGNYGDYGKEGGYNVEYKKNVLEN